MLRAILSSIFADIVALYFCSLFLYNSDQLFCPYLVLDIAVVLRALSGVALAWGGGGGGGPGRGRSNILWTESWCIDPLRNLMMNQGFSKPVTTRFATQLTYNYS